jgi:hypothetical protein
MTALDILKSLANDLDVFQHSPDTGTFKFPELGSVAVDRRDVEYLPGWGYIAQKTTGGLLDEKVQYTITDAGQKFMDQQLRTNSGCLPIARQF